MPHKEVRGPAEPGNRLVLRRRLGESLVLTAPTGERLVLRLDRQAGRELVLVFEGSPRIRVLRSELREREEAA